MIQTDLFDYLEGDNPRTMLNFALNLVDAGNQPTRLSMKIKPSVMIGAQSCLLSRLLHHHKRVQFGELS